MYDRFPELRGQPAGVPPEDGFLDGLFFLGWLCALVYVIPFLAIALSASGLRYAANALSLFGLAICCGGPCLGRDGTRWLVVSGTARPHPGRAHVLHRLRFVSERTGRLPIDLGNSPKTCPRPMRPEHHHRRVWDIGSSRRCAGGSVDFKLL